MCVRARECPDGRTMRLLHTRSIVAAPGGAPVAVPEVGLLHHTLTHSDRRTGAPYSRHSVARGRLTLGTYSRLTLSALSVPAQRNSDGSWWRRALLAPYSLGTQRAGPAEFGWELVEERRPNEPTGEGGATRLCCTAVFRCTARRAAWSAALLHYPLRCTSQAQERVAPPACCTACCTAYRTFACCTALLHCSPKAQEREEPHLLVALLGFLAQPAQLRNGPPHFRLHDRPGGPDPGGVEVGDGRGSGGGAVRLQRPVVLSDAVQAGPLEAVARGGLGPHAGVRLGVRQRLGHARARARVCVCVL